MSAPGTQEARPAFGDKSRRVVSAARRGAPYCAPPMVLLATPGFISTREKCRLLPQVLPNAKLRQIAQIKNLTELLNYLAPREWVGNGFEPSTGRETTVCSTD